MSTNFAAAATNLRQKSDTTQKKLTTTKNSYLRSGLHLALPPLKPAATSAQKFSVIRPGDKLLNDVQVFPNPITDQINIKYSLSHNALVTVKVMDVLGNDLITIEQERISSGEQTVVFPIGNRLQKGFYFIRVVAGTESVIKRISVL
jgi:hypothetical protein